MALFIFDKDGTLIFGKTIHVLHFRNPVKPEEQILMPGVFEKIAELRRQGHVIAIASNLSGVAKGIMTPEQAERLMVNCADKLGGVAAWKYCGYDPKGKKTVHGKPNPYAQDHPCHKPHPGMILELMDELGFGPKETYVIGNKKTDQQAAQAAGAYYIQRSKFFRV